MAQIWRRIGNLALSVRNSSRLYSPFGKRTEDREGIIDGETIDVAMPTVVPTVEMNSQNPVYNSYYNAAYNASTGDITLNTPTSVDLGDTKADKKKIKPVTTDENVERGNWSGQLDFLLSCLGYAVGLGNVWRFPYMCYRNGGGAFLVPYVIFLIFVGMPIFLLDLSLGQFSSQGPMTCWEFMPLFAGVGCAMTLISFYVTIYYNVIIAYSIYYTFVSMANPLPWQGCYHKWNTENCRDRLPLVNCSTAVVGPHFDSKLDGKCYFPNGTFYGLYDEELYFNVTGNKRQLPAQEYFNNEILGLTSSIADIGPVHWQLLLCLLASWIIVFLCMIRGIKSSGKVVYVTALFPYLVLLILFFRGVTLEGAGDGLYFYLVPDFHKLREATVWKDAANQIFFSLSASWGGLITLSSYNRFNNNVIRDTLIVTMSNCGTSVFAGFVIFSFLGHLAKEMQTTVDKVADKGIGLAFVVYPSAVTTMPVSTLWAILFFIMLLTLGLDSQFTMLETVITALLDRFPDLRHRKTFYIAGFCILLFILGIPLTAGGGPYWLQLMDVYCGGWAILLIGLFECIALGWVYGRPGFRGPHRFLQDIEVMVGHKVSIWWRITWQYTAPLLIVVILIFAWADYKPITYDERPYPIWADSLGWMMTLSAILCIPGVLIYKVVRDKDGGSILQTIQALTLPSYLWGPALEKHRVTYGASLEDSTHFYVNPKNRILYKDYINRVQFEEDDLIEQGVSTIQLPSRAIVPVSHRDLADGRLENDATISGPRESDI